MQVSDHIPGYKGKTVGVARQSDVFIFHSPIGNFGDAEYLTCCRLSRSDFVEPFKRSTQRNNGSNRKNGTTILDFYGKIRYIKPLLLYILKQKILFSGMGACRGECMFHYFLKISRNIVRIATVKHSS